MPYDTRGAALRATSYVPDKRVSHYWDLWKYGSRSLAEKLGIPEQETWDLFAFYRPNVSWKEATPEPTFWMQARGLKKGEEYSKAGLLSKLETWLP